MRKIPGKRCRKNKSNLGPAACIGAGMVCINCCVDRCWCYYSSELQRGRCIGTPSFLSFLVRVFYCIPPHCGVTNRCFAFLGGAYQVILGVDHELELENC